MITTFNYEQSHEVFGNLFKHSQAFVMTISQSKLKLKGKRRKIYVN